LSLTTQTEQILFELCEKVKLSDIQVRLAQTARSFYLTNLFDMK